MANAKEIKERIAGIEETRKITNAMYLIASSKMRQAKEKLAEVEPFFFEMQSKIMEILCFWPELQNPYFNMRPEKTGKERNIGIIAITSDKGLSGAFNHNIVKSVEKKIRGENNYKLYMIGEVGWHHFAGKHKDIMDEDFHFPAQNPTLSRARTIAYEMIELFNSGELDEIWMVYTKAKSAISVEVEEMKLLPLKKGTFDSMEGASCSIKSLSFYPSADEVMSNIAPIYIYGIIYGCLVESYYSEQSSRMLAMQNATNSATDMLTELNMTYNRVRQADITQELTEVVAGANAQKRK